MSDFKLLPIAVLLAFIGFIAFQAIEPSDFFSPWFNNCINSRDYFFSSWYECDSSLNHKEKSSKTVPQETNRGDIKDITVVVPTETQPECTGPKVFRDRGYCGISFTFITPTQNEGDEL